MASRRDEHRVTAPHGGTVVEWLVEDGDPVSPGQPLRPPAPRRGRRMTALSSPPPAPSTPRILGIGAYRPSRVVPNAELVEAIDSTDEWIQQRSGIKAAALGRARGDRRR